MILQCISFTNMIRIYQYILKICKNVCMYIATVHNYMFLFVIMYAWMHVVCIYVCLHICMCVYICSYVYTYVCMHVRMYECIFGLKHISICVFMHVHMCVQSTIMHVQETLYIANSWQNVKYSFTFVYVLVYTA